jgi:hypothetical protein
VTRRAILRSRQTGVVVGLLDAHPERDGMDNRALAVAIVREVERERRRARWFGGGW